jgi:predicted dithiol-disulfide oxidoreductase (DUF899 family)
MSQRKKVGAEDQSQSDRGGRDDFTIRNAGNNFNLNLRGDRGDGLRAFILAHHFIYSGTISEVRGGRVVSGVCDYLDLCPAGIGERRRAEAVTVLTLQKSASLPWWRRLLRWVKRV